MPEINVHVIELPAQANEMAVIKALQANPHIKFAELDYLLDPSPGVNDPSFSSEWHLPNIAVPAAWDTRTGGGVTIAILDSGVGTTHPDLEAQLVPGWNAYDNNSDTSDVFGHGTQVAGTAAAAGNNSIGVAGVAFGAKIMPIRVTDTSGMGYASSMANGLTWAADKGARAANLSFQGVSGSSTVLSAAQYFRSKNGVVVNSAGNAGTSGSVAVTIANDTVLPVVAIQSHADGSTVSGSVAVSVAATDNKNVAEIILSIDGKQVAAACSSSLSYTWSTGSTATKGKKTATTTLVSHTLTAVAKDASGNQASRSIVVKSQ